jgi:putative tryptophan/tyrosine transport system substrate-binding protein
VEGTRGGRRPHIVRALSCDDVGEAATIVFKVLKGVKPGDLPVEQPHQVRAGGKPHDAKALSLTIPGTFLLRADGVIE